MEIIKIMRNNWMESLHWPNKLRFSTKIIYSRWNSKQVPRKYNSSKLILLALCEVEMTRNLWPFLANDRVCMHILCWHIVSRLMLAAASDFGCCGIGVDVASCIGKLRRHSVGALKRVVVFPREIYASLIRNCRLFKFHRISLLISRHSLNGTNIEDKKSMRLFSIISQDITLISLIFRENLLSY